VPRSDLMSWAELRELQRSGLVEIASHSYAMHEGIVANPQGNREPAAIARQWLADAQGYESEPAYAARVRSDLKRNSDLIRKELGRAPRVIVWPYGRYNQTTRILAEKLGEGRLPPMCKRQAILPFTQPVPAKLG